MSTIKENNGNNRSLIYTIIGILLIGISVFLVFQYNQQPQAIDTNTAQPIVEVVEEKTDEGEVIFDEDGAKLTKELKKVGLNIGFVGSTLYKSLGIEFPEKATADEVESLQGLFPNYQPLSTLIEAPTNPQKRNQLVWDKYEIIAPIQYATFDDIFIKQDGGFVYNQYVDNNPIDSPVQLKLRDGIVHLPFSPAPGETGNSYIIGHSSNYNNVKSDYNYVFAPLINEVSVGETFRIYDYLGRELNFEVIETKVVNEEDSSAAYVNYPNNRVVTLQGSILETINGQILPTKRYLVIAELRLPETLEPVEEVQEKTPENSQEI